MSLTHYLQCLAFVFLVTASPIQDESQTVLIQSNDNNIRGVGWFDPRVNGGQFLDVRSSGSSTVTTFVDDDTAIVHDETIWRTSKRHNIRPLRSIHPNRPGATRLRQVRLSPLFSHSPRIDLTILLRSLGYSEECLGLHYGDLHEADLGDGDGKKKEYFLARQHYFPVWGTCWESLAGLSPLSLTFPQPSNPWTNVIRRTTFPRMETERDKGE
jgi:hypothetical protein